MALKPHIWEAVQAHRDGVVTYKKNGTAVVKYDGKKFAVLPEHQYDLTQATIFGLNERLTMAATSPVVDASGETLREQFNSEWETYAEKIAGLENGALEYGYYAFYPERRELARFCPPYWHHVVAVASSSTLLTDKEHKLSWKQIRELFEKTTIAVAGCSVGSSIIHAGVMDLRPAALKVADKSVYKMENINRVRLGYGDVVKSQAERSGMMDLALRNKAEVVANQLYAIDPFLDVYVYSEGIQADNVVSFLDGDGREPKADIVVEEVDDPRIKIFIREEARKRKLPLIMVTDIGSAVQLDVVRYDKDPEASLTYGTTDEVLYEKMEAVYKEAGNRKVFFEFVDALIGTDYRQGELDRIIKGEAEIPTSTIIPQLGSTVAMAGAIAAEAIARIRLGFDYPPRVIINKHTFAVTVSR